MFSVDTRNSRGNGRFGGGDYNLVLDVLSLRHLHDCKYSYEVDREGVRDINL